MEALFGNTEGVFLCLMINFISIRAEQWHANLQLSNNYSDNILCSSFTDFQLRVVAPTFSLFSRKLLFSLEFP